MYLSAEGVARGLGGKKEGEGWVACCPAHEDKNPSLAISEGADGKVLVHCRAGCHQADVISALRDAGLWYQKPHESSGPQTEKEHSEYRYAGPLAAGAPKPELKDPSIGELVAEYEYVDETGRPLGYVRRFKNRGGKTYRPLTPWYSGPREVQWLIKGFPKPYPIYGVQQLLERPECTVLVVEGEKAANAARPIFPDYVVVTWPGGTSGARFANWKALAGRTVIIWPDADVPGKKAGEAIFRQLDQISKLVKLIDLPDDLPKGWDLADEPPEGFDPVSHLIDSLGPDRALVPYILTAVQMLAEDINPREYVVAPFIATDSISMVYATRGLGKTWFCLSLAIAVARGEQFLFFEVPKKRKALYIDGEMAIADLKQRLERLDGAETENLLILASEVLFRNSEPININEATTQERVIKTLEILDEERNRPSLIVLDNLSSLGGGIDENDNTALEDQLRWLMNLRHMGYAVLLVHHAGKSGDQRGASRREDQLDTSIRLEKPKAKAGEEPIRSAAFLVDFTKTRGETPAFNNFRLELTENAYGKLDWGMDASADSRPEEVTLRTILEGDTSLDFRQAFKKQAELSQALDVAKSTVSKHLKVLREAKLILEDDDLGIRVTYKGLNALRRLYKDIDSFIGEATVTGGDQDNLPI